MSWLNLRVKHALPPRPRNWERSRHLPLHFEQLEARLALTLFTVTSLDDGPVDTGDAKVTLRDAINAANNDVPAFRGGPPGGVFADVIRFQSGLTGTIKLTEGLLRLTSSLSITGPGPEVLTVSGDGKSTVFDVTDFSTTTTRNVTISGLTITGGSAVTGGGIGNVENLTIQNCTIDDNDASVEGGGVFNGGLGTMLVQNSTITGTLFEFATKQGGGISNYGNLTVENSTIAGNYAVERGGGLYNAESGILTLRNATLRGNVVGNASVSGEAGAIHSSGQLSIEESDVSGNSAIGQSATSGSPPGGSVGAISNYGIMSINNTTINDNFAGQSTGALSNSGTISIRNSVIAQNAAREIFGAISNLQGTMTIEATTIGSNGAGTAIGGIFNNDGAKLKLQNSTLSSNTAALEVGGIYNSGELVIENTTISGNKAGGPSGGILNTFGGALTLINSTVAQNHSDNDNTGEEQGGGIFNQNLFGVVIHNTIVADNYRGSGTTVEDDITGESFNADGSGNLIGTAGSGGLGNGANGNQVGVADPKLGPLAFNGGTRQTHALLVGSPAIDKGRNSKVPLDTLDLDGDGNTTEPIPFDERGLTFNRIFNGIIDVGAFEFQVPFPWHNFSNPLDVRGATTVTPDNSVDPGDALAIINFINAFVVLNVPDNAEEGQPFGFLDVIKYNVVAPDDALMVINAINSRPAAEPEAEEEQQSEVGVRESAEKGQLSMDSGQMSEQLMSLLAMDAIEQGMKRKRG
jgi:CSLREA domain-containing protein